MSISQELSSDFSSIIRSRGSDYFQSKFVKILHGDEWMVVANVLGDKGYRVQISRDNESVYVFCECPYYESEGPCKHLWATILAADEKDLLCGDMSSEPLVLVEVDEEFFDDVDDPSLYAAG